MNARGAGGAAARKPKIGAFPPEAPFLPALARLWLGHGGDTSDGLIILPSRRAAQALAGAFLEANKGKALLLPRIVALGNIDEAGLLVNAGFALPPAISATRRQAMLARLILARGGEGGAPVRLHAAWRLAAELASLLDEADHAEIDLAEALPRLVPEELAGHWQTSLEFLTIVTRAWPEILAGEGAMNPAARLAALISAQARAWGEHPPPHRIWMVAAEGTPAIARMAKTVAGLAQGLLILPGYDPHMDDAAWEALGDAHPQSGIARLLAEIGVRREEIEVYGVPGGRSAVFSRTLLPAAALAAWQEKAALDLAGISRLETPEEAGNAMAIAMILRDTLEVPGRTAALVTPDRALAVRVAAALKRFGITADDSAGEPLNQTPPATLLRLLARAMVAEYAPLPLLALLKHPLTAGGLPPQDFRNMARRIERHALRGPRPPPGFDGIKYRLREKHQAERDFLDALELRLKPLALAEAVNPAEALRKLVEVGEALAATPDMPGAAVLWAGEAGIALSELLLDMLGTLEDLPDIGRGELADLLDALLEGAVVRRPRAKDGHPRIAIWGLQEAALQSVDVAVLGGLVEGVWPGASEPGPFLSRPMRQGAGLPSPEWKTAQAGHGFFSLACACKEIVLAVPNRRERAPAVPARWVTRLDAMLAGAGVSLPRHPASSWAAQLDLPVARERREKPRPRPPASARPRELSISDIAALITDPYAIYARKILNIRELDPLDEESDSSQFGEIVHAGMKAFFDADGMGRNDPVAALNACLQTAMRTQRPRAALENWWAARLERIAAWVVENERGRGTPQALVHELKAALDIPEGFRLTGRADRIERRADGSVAIIDYKTGTVPEAKKVEAGTAPQLPLEAVMAEAGAFGPEFAAKVTELTYVKLSGRAEAGKDAPLFANKPEKLREIIGEAAAGLPALFKKFADGGTPYLASPHPQRSNEFNPYAGISRHAEWAGEDGDDGD